jgi:hypothetical protein
MSYTFYFLMFSISQNLSVVLFWSPTDYVMHVVDCAIIPDSFYWRFLTFKYFYCYAWWGFIVAFSKALKIYQIFLTWIHPLNTSFIFLPPSPGIISTGVIFPFAYMCTQYLHYIRLPTPFPTSFLLPLEPNRPQPQEIFCTLALQFC